MPKFFAFSAMVAEDRLHDVMTALEMMGGSFQLLARPVPVEAGNAMLRQMGVEIEPPRAKAAPKQLAEPKPKAGTGPRMNADFIAQQEASKKFLAEHESFTYEEFSAALIAAAPNRVADFKSRLNYYVAQGTLIKLGRNQYGRNTSNEQS